jgi:hypothetical protein
VNLLTLAEARSRAGRPDQAVALLEEALASPWFRDRRREEIERQIEIFKQRAAEKRDRGSR